MGERMVFELCGRDDELVANLQADLSQNGKYQVSDEIAKKFADLFFGGCCDDGKTKETIAKYKDMELPAIIVIPGISGSMGLGMNEVRESAKRAIGADILFNE